MGYIGIIAHLLTIDPNFQPDIQVLNTLNPPSHPPSRMLAATPWFAPVAGRPASWSVRRRLSKHFKTSTAVATPEEMSHKAWCCSTCRSDQKTQTFPPRFLVFEVWERFEETKNWSKVWTDFFCEKAILWRFKDGMGEISKPKDSTLRWTCMVHVGKYTMRWVEIFDSLFHPDPASMIAIPSWSWT